LTSVQKMLNFCNILNSNAIETLSWFLIKLVAYNNRKVYTCSTCVSEFKGGILILHCAQYRLIRETTVFNDFPPKPKKVFDFFVFNTL